MKRRALLQSALGVLLLALWLRLAPIQDVLRDEHVARWTPLFAILALTLASFTLRSWRWQQLVRPLRRITLREAFVINAAGTLLNFLLPIRSGEAARAWWLSRRHGVAAGSGVATILVDKLFDLGAVAAVLGVAAAAVAGAGAAPAVSRGLTATALFACALVAALVLVAVAGPGLTRSRLFALLPARWRTVLQGQAFAFRTGAREMLSARPGRLIAVTFAALAVDALAFSLLFSALGLDVPVLAAAAGYSAILLSYVVPAAPGYVGNLEVVGSLVGAGLGLSAAAAAGSILLWHGLNAVFVLGLGAIGLHQLRPASRAAGAGVRRIAVFHCGFTYSGGGERIVLEEVFGLRARGYTVDCFAPAVDQRACYPDLLPSVAPRTFLPALPNWVPCHEALQMLAASALVPLYFWRFRGVDVFLGCNQPGAWIAWACARLLGRPYIVYLNQPNRLVYPRPIDVQTGWLTNPSYRLLDRLVSRLRGAVAWADRVSIRGADELLVNGRYIGDVIRRTYGRQALDCPAGCHVTASAPAPSRFEGSVRVAGRPVAKPYVLLTNRHYPQKRFDLAIEAMALVAKSHPGARLVIPGPDTSHTAELRNMVASLGLERNVLFCGVISEAELQRLYEQAAVYVYPAPEEDFGMGVIEAMAKGVPVVAWNQAGPKVTVDAGRTGHLAEPLDVAGYAAGITRYLDDPKLNLATGRRALARARLFDWSNHVDTLEGALLAAAGQPVAVGEVAAAAPIA